MTPLEYMERQLARHRRNYEREAARGVPSNMLASIGRKITCYEAAVNALRKEQRDVC